MKPHSPAVIWRVISLLLSLLLPGLLPHVQAAGTTFGAAQVVGTGYYPRLVDMDNDGDQDVAALKNVSVMGGQIYTPVWLENKGTTFTEHTIIDWQCQMSYMEPADLDGDGDIDLVIGSSGIYKYTPGITYGAWLENDGAKPPHFTPHSLFDSPTNYSKRSLCVADLDNDGDLDVVAAFEYGDSSLLLWYENDGGRPPRFTSHTLARTRMPFYNMLLATDLDGDGWRDVLLGTTGGTQGFKNSRLKNVPFKAFPICANRGQLGVADLNGDGKPDVLVGFEWCENRGGEPTTFTTHRLAPGFTAVSFDNGQVAVGDLDRDGHPDAVGFDPLGGTSVGKNLCWFQNDGKASPSFSLHVLGSAHLYPQIGDLTGDGNLDVICTGSYDALTLYRNQAALAPVTVLTPSESGRAYTSGNKLDIYWRTDTKKAGTAVTLELWQGNKKVAALGSSYSATGRGHAQVTLPLVASGGGYRIKAVSSDAPTLYWDFSDEPFAIKGKANGVARPDWAGYP